MDMLRITYYDMVFKKILINDLKEIGVKYTAYANTVLIKGITAINMNKDIIRIKALQADFEIMTDGIESYYII